MYAASCDQNKLGKDPIHFFFDQVFAVNTAIAAAARGN